MDLCREKGCISIERNSDGFLKMLFGPLPVSKEKEEKKDTDPRASKRAHYANLLGKIVPDAELDLLPD